MPQVPGGPPPPEPGMCPPTGNVDGTMVEPCASQGWDVWFYGDPIADGEECCYNAEIGCAVGRPFLVDDRVRTARVTSRRDWKSSLVCDVDRLSPAARRLLGAAWLEDAKLEHASVAAFARLTLELMGLGAPPELIAGSQQASLDEIQHARDCFALASAFSAEPLGPDCLAVSDALTTPSLIQLAVTTFREGCVGETIAALLAQEQLQVAESGAVRATLETIVEDETRHAELAWRVVSWAVQRGGLEVARAIRAAFEAELRVAPSAPATSQLEAERAEHDALRRHGRLSYDDRSALRIQALREVVAPCLSALLQQPRTQERPHVAV
ncbi:MAG: ferritin-like domain-containing protein [Polyangiaceae bacterium]